MPYIAKTIKPYIKALKTAEAESKNTNASFKLMHLLLYGSSITKNNPMPNDIDCSSHIFVGEYNYDGKNEEEITRHIVERIENFYYLLFSNAEKLPDIYPYKKADKIYAAQTKYNKIVIDSMAKHFSAALSGKYYLLNTKTQINKKKSNYDFIPQYALLKPHTMLFKNEFYSTFFYSDKISFNEGTLKYIRALTDHPVFFVKINYNGKSEYIQIISDKLSSKAFAPHEDRTFNIVLVESKTKKDFADLYSFNDKDLYIFKRRMAYEGHLLSLETESSLKKRTLKTYKRLLQSAMLVKQYIGNEKYSEIYDYISEYQNNRDVQLLNDFENIFDNVFSLSTSDNLYFTMQRNGKFKSAFHQLLSITKEMDERGNINKKSIQKYMFFINHDFYKFINLKDPITLKNRLKEINITFDNEVFNYLYSDYSSLIKEQNKLNKYMQTVKRPYVGAGFHEIQYYWINSNTIGIVKDDFTSGIKDKDKFIEENNLPSMNIKLVKLPKNINNGNKNDDDLNVLYKMYVRYNPTQKENSNYEKLKNSFLECMKKDFKYHKKTIYLR